MQRRVNTKRRNKGVSSFRVSTGRVRSRFLIPEHRLGELTQILAAIVTELASDGGAFGAVEIQSSGYGLDALTRLTR